MERQDKYRLEEVVGLQLAAPMVAEGVVVVELRLPGGGVVCRPSLEGKGIIFIRPSSDADLFMSRTKHLQLST